MVSTYAYAASLSLLRDSDEDRSRRCGRTVFVSAVTAPTSYHSSSRASAGPTNLPAEEEQPEQHHHAERHACHVEQRRYQDLALATLSIDFDLIHLEPPVRAKTEQEASRAQRGALRRLCSGDLTQ